MQFQGVNKGVERTDLPPGASPDAVNCFFHKGRQGVLGQRKGKTFQNSTAYAANVMGAPALVSPGGSRYWQVGLTDGSMSQDAAPQSSEPSGTPSVSYNRKYVYGTPAVLSGSWPTASAVTVPISASIPAGVYQIFVPRDFTMTMTIAGGVEEADIWIWIWFLDASSNVISNLTDLIKLDTSGSGLIWAADSSTFFKSTLTLSGTATQVTYTPLISNEAGVTDWTFYAGPFTGFTLRST